MKLADLGAETLAQIDAVLLGESTRRGLYDRLVDFASAVAARDGQLLAPSDASPKLDRSALLRARKYIGIVQRNDLTGPWVSVSYDVPSDGDPTEALRCRCDVRARSSFDVFAESVATRLVPKREQALLGRVAPIVQSVTHRAWTKIWDDPRNHRYLIEAHNEAAKSTQQSVLRPLFELARDHNLKIGLLTNTSANAQALLRQISEIILNSVDFKRIFPGVRPALPWNLSEIQIERDQPDKNPSIAAYFYKSAILGARLDLLFIDDLVDAELSSTPSQIAELSRWFKANVTTRLTEDCRVVGSVTPWAIGDLYTELEATGEYKIHRFPVLSAKGESTSPDLWPIERIRQRERELGPREFARSMMLEIRTDEEALFKEAHVTQALQLGLEFPRVRTIDDLDGRLRLTERLICGVDLATGSKRKRADDSAYANLLIDEAEGTITIIGLEHGRWSPTTTRTRISDVVEWFPSTQVHVEDNGGQAFFLDELRRLSLPVHGFTTSAALKHDQSIGIPGLATQFETGRIIIPAWIAQSPSGKALVHALLYYRKEQHTPDVLAALWIGFCAYAVAKRTKRAVPGANMRIIDGSSFGTPPTEDRRQERPPHHGLFDPPAQRPTTSEDDARAALRDKRSGGTW